MNIRKVLIWTIPTIIITVLIVRYIILETQKGQGWTTETSYTGEFVEDIAIDSQNRIWVGSLDVRVFDGQTWTTYTSQDIGLNSWVKSIEIDAQDRIWVEKGDGIAVLDGQNWISYTEENSGSEGNIFLWSIATDAQGQTWFRTVRGGVSVYDGHTWTTYTTEDSGLVSNKISDIVPDDHGGVWIGTQDNGLSYFKDQTWKTYETKYLGKGSRVEYIQIDSLGQVWVGTDNGLNVFDGNRWQSWSMNWPRHWTDFVFDKQGRTWVGKSTGLSLLSDGHWINYTPSNSGMLYPFVRKIKVDQQDRIWLACANEGLRSGDSLTVFDGQTWQNFTTENSALPDGRLPEFVLDSQNRLWMGDGAELIVFDESQARPLNEDQEFLNRHLIFIIFVLVILWIGALVDALVGLGLTAGVSLLVYLSLIKLGFSPQDSSTGLIKWTLSPYDVFIPAIGGLLGVLIVKFKSKSDSTVRRQMSGAVIGFAIGTGLILSTIILCRLAVLLLGQ